MGATISCGGVKLHPQHPVANIPHVQGYLGATDKVGLRILLNTQKEPATGVFSCHASWLTAVRLSEVGASEAILKAGYNIGSLMLRYHGVDFRDPTKADCNAHMNPLTMHMYDGIDLHPLEVMFVKAQHPHVATEHPSVMPALKYEEWADADKKKGAADINSNEFK